MVATLLEGGAQTITYDSELQPPSPTRESNGHSNMSESNSITSPSLIRSFLSCNPSRKRKIATNKENLPLSRNRKVEHSANQAAWVKNSPQPRRRGVRVVTVRRLFHISTWTSTMCTLVINVIHPSFSRFLILVPTLNRDIADTVPLFSLFLSFHG